MSKTVKTQQQNRKSASDLEQWLSEINLFTQETQSELHDIAGLLNLALANDHHRELDVGSRLNAGGPLEATTGTSAALSRPSDAEGDDNLASLQHKLSKQLKSKRSSSLPSHSEPPIGEPNTARPGGSENSNRFGDLNADDRSF
jgi:hypothetical protein